MGGVEPRKLRTRHQVLRGRGSIQFADDDGRHGGRCYVCTSDQEVRFVQFNSPVRGERMFLRICAACLDVVHAENETMKP